MKMKTTSKMRISVKLVTLMLMAMNLMALTLTLMAMKLVVPTLTLTKSMKLVALTLMTNNEDANLGAALAAVGGDNTFPDNFDPGSEKDVDLGDFFGGL